MLFPKVRLVKCSATVVSMKAVEGYIFLGGAAIWGTSGKSQGHHDSPTNPCSYFHHEHLRSNDNLLSFSPFLNLQADTTHPLTKHRKIASSFRDSSLFDIFTLSCNLLKQVRKLETLVLSLNN